MPFTTDVTPGPSVVRHALGRPVTSDCAIAAMAPAVSVCVRTNGRPAWPAASITSRLLPPPGIPNSARTPASRKRLTIASATVIIGASCYRRRVATAELHQDLRNAVRDLCHAFPDSYWRDLDARRAYPDVFVRALTEAGYL